MPAPFILGWEEWLALPALGLPAIKAKVDTGARTSALHAHHIEQFGPANAPLVRFAVHPVAGRTDVEVTCSAPVVGRRDVTSSNGEREARYVIVTDVKVGDRTWPIEITLTNRETMSYRMLLGRQAIREDMYVDPASSFRQPKLNFKAYKQLPRRDVVRRPLRIAILATKTQSSSARAIADEAAARGHVVESIDPSAAFLRFERRLPSLSVKRKDVGHFDAVIPRLGAAAAPFTRAVLRQLEMTGAVALNSADALARLADPLATRQRLLRAAVNVWGPSRVAIDDARARAPVPVQETIRFLVVGRTVTAALSLAGDAKPRDATASADKSFRRIAISAAKSLSLRLAAIDVAEINGDAHVIAISALPDLTPFARICDATPARSIITDVESQVRSWIRTAEAEPPSPVMKA